MCTLCCRIQSKTNQPWYPEASSRSAPYRPSIRKRLNSHVARSSPCVLLRRACQPLSPPAVHQKHETTPPKRWERMKSGTNCKGVATVKEGKSSGVQVKVCRGKSDFRPFLSIPLCINGTAHVGLSLCLMFMLSSDSFDRPVSVSILLSADNIVNSLDLQDIPRSTHHLYRRHC
jgi:hypothetical protein